MNSILLPLPPPRKHIPLVCNGSDLYAIGNESLVRFDSGLPSPTAIGTGFDSNFEDMVFRGSSLYVCDTDKDRILEITLIPAPGAALLGTLGLSFSGWLMRNRRVL